MNTAQDFIEVTEPDQVSKERQQVGRTLYIYAWGVEICAVLIGLAIAIMQGIASFSEMSDNSMDMGFAGWTNIFIAAMPFLMVAVVELTKIPFVGAFYKTSSLLWKSVFGLSLLFIAFITFESAMNGFERNFHSLIYSIDKFKKELIATEEEIVPKEDYRNQLLSLKAEDIESEYNQRLSQISEESSNQTSAIQDRINSLRASIQTEYTIGLTDQITDAKQELEGIRSDRKKELDQLFNQYNSSRNSSNDNLQIHRRSLQQQLKNAEAQWKEASRQAKINIDNAFFLSKESVKQEEYAKVDKAEKRVESIRAELNNLSSSSATASVDQRYNEDKKRIKSEYQRQIDSVNKRIQQLSLEKSKSVGVREKDIETQIATHFEEMKAVNAKFSDQRAENDRVRDNDLTKLRNNEALIEEIDAEILLLKNSRVDLRNKINVKVGDNQVYRMAQWWYGKESAADLDRSDVMVIAAIWFGSLATLIAFTGILLALASYVIRDPRLKDRGDTSGGPKGIRPTLLKAINSFRRYTVHKRKIERAPRTVEVPVEVVKEIPVQKVVTTEKPVEIIKKELVHVPFYTNDQNLLNSNETVDLSSKPTTKADASEA
jgi:hypothetical protein